MRMAAKMHEFLRDLSGERNFQFLKYLIVFSTNLKRSDKLALLPLDGDDAETFFDDVLTDPVFVGLLPRLGPRVRKSARQKFIKRVMHARQIYFRKLRNVTVAADQQHSFTRRSKNFKEMLARRWEIRPLFKTVFFADHLNA